MPVLNDTPQVWIACLASYNAGRLIGEWVDATDVDVMNEAQKRVAEAGWKAAVKCGDAPIYFGYPEEFAIHDYNGFGNIANRLGEYPNYETVAKIGALIEAHGDAFLAYVSAVEVELDDIDEDSFHESYRGEWSSEEAYAVNYVNDMGGWGGVPSVVEVQSNWQTVKISVFEELESYIDWETIAREIFDHGDHTAVPANDGDFHVFQEQH